MANTITSKTMLTSYKHVILYITLKSDGSQETGTVVYDSSVQATSGGQVDPLTSRIKRIWYTTSGKAVVAKLNWDASTPVDAYAFATNNGNVEMDFTCIGGLSNLGGTGITGDLTLTTTGLASGDSITLVMDVDPCWASNGR